MEELGPRWKVTIITEWAVIVVTPHAYSEGEAIWYAEALIEDSLGLHEGHMSKVRFNYEVELINETEGE